MLRETVILRQILLALALSAFFVNLAAAGKVTVCHVPPGNPLNIHTIVVSDSAVAAHLQHGDSLGACPVMCDGVRSRVPATGQTRCWDTDGVEIDCAGTGQDGDLRMGASVSPRFTDNGDGTVTDNLTGLIWLQNPRCFCWLEWRPGLERVHQLANGCGGLSDGSAPGDWRAPNIKELESLVDYGQEVLGPPPGHPFEWVHDNLWSSTVDERNPQFLSWGLILFYYEVIDSFWNRAPANFWPVRGGAVECDSVPSPVPKTGQTTCWDAEGDQIACAGTGQDGEYQAGVSVVPRFADNRNGTVRDNLTGLVWLQDPNCLGWGTWQHALDTANTLASGSCGLTDDSMSGDWRLPNIKELLSLLDYSQEEIPYPPGHPFSGPLWGSYWSSSTPLADTDRAWVAPYQNGKVSAPAKRISDRVWPVRSGRTD